MTLPIKGYCHPKFQEVSEAFKTNFTDRNELGASCSIIVDGQCVVDLWGGHKDIKKTQAWEPEFARNGKDAITVRMMLGHQSALPALRDPVKPGGFYDFDYMAERLAAETPFWEPGTDNGYHMITFGWTVGELIRRVSGKSLGQFFKDEIANPLGLDFHIGEAWQAEIGGAGGISNARALAKMFAALWGDNAYLSHARIEDMRTLCSQTQKDRTLQIPTRFAQGFMLKMDNRDTHPGDGKCRGWRVYRICRSG